MSKLTARRMPECAMYPFFVRQCNPRAVHARHIDAPDQNTREFLLIFTVPF